jgi:hypothetical protein
MRFNDDDFYVIDIATMTVIKRVGCKCAQPTPQPGQMVVKGMRAKYMELN